VQDESKTKKEEKNPLAAVLGALGKDKDGKEGMGKFAKSLGKMMDSDAMKQMMSTQLKTMISGQYRDLFDQLGLDEATRTQVEELLASRMGQGQSIGMKLMSGADKAAMTEASKELKKERAEIDEKLKTALGPEKYETLNRYDDSQPERQSLTMLKARLGSGDRALNADQEQQLMNLMYKTRKDAKYDHNYGDQRSFEPEMMETEAITKYQGQSAATNEKVLSESAAFLNPDQVEALRDHQKNMKQMESMGLEMLKTLSGSGDAK
jgi:hypothetical protein